MTRTRILINDRVGIAHRYRRWIYFYVMDRAHTAQLWMLFLFLLYFPVNQLGKVIDLFRD